MVTHRGICSVFVIGRNGAGELNTQETELRGIHKGLIQLLLH